MPGYAQSNAFRAHVRSSMNGLLTVFAMSVCRGGGAHGVAASLREDRSLRMSRVTPAARLVPA